MNITFDLSQELGSWLWAVVALVVALFGFQGLKRLLWKRLELWAAKSASTVDDLLLERLSAPVSLLLLIVAFAIASQVAPEQLSEHPGVMLFIKVAFVATGLWVLDRLLSVAFKAGLSKAKLGQSMRQLLLNLSRAVLYSVGGLVVLDTAGISITPVLASLGVGSVAVALALQDTLSNFFSGLYLLADEPFRIGDFIRVEDGVEGHVEKIGWRSARIRTLGNNRIVVPNSKLASSRLTNFDLEDRELSLPIEVGVGYECDLSRVETVTIDVARQILSTTPGGVPSFQPAVLFHTFGDSSIGFTVVLRARQYTDQALLKHEFIKALHKRYAVEGISIPFPQRVLHVKPAEFADIAASLRLPGVGAPALAQSSSAPRGE
ncbi:MAG: mechanosensitive ion channel family protein [Oligoflexia bacterium]|nr:mechanosensitive ion channel family protein [Oligoflexia bacterium]